MGDYESFYSTNNYKIQINILYNSKEGDDTNTNTDELNSNYYIIDNMQDILLEEFSNKKIYEDFNKIHKDKTPLYIVNDSYYIDKYVIDTIRKSTSGKFPAFGPNEDIEAENFDNNIRILLRDRNGGYENKLVEFFKTTLAKMITDKKSVIPDNFSTISRLRNLFDECKDLIKKNTFKNIIKNQYESTKDRELKEALRVFYNIPTSSFVKKSKYEYFLDTKIINNIFKVIDENSNSDDSIFGGRRSSLNNSQTKEDIYNKYFKYVFPNKKDITVLTDQDKDKILMFNNVYYIIKNIYLLDNTIIKVKNFKNLKSVNETKYYISQVSLLDLKDNITHFKIEKNKVTIFVKATLKYIIEYPILQINYLIDDLENAKQKFLLQSYILQPKDISNNYSSYDKIYIDDNIKYITNVQNIDTIAINSRKKKYIENKEELFLNTKALRLLIAFFKKNKKDTNSLNKIIESNIKYILYKIFKFYNNKKFKNYYIADTYIKYNVDGSQYYSITRGKITEQSTKYNIISSIFDEEYNSAVEAETEAKAKAAEAKAKATAAEAAAVEVEAAAAAAKAAAEAAAATATAEAAAAVAAGGVAAVEATTAEAAAAAAERAKTTAAEAKAARAEATAARAEATAAEKEARAAEKEARAAPATAPATASATAPATAPATATATATAPAAATATATATATAPAAEIEQQIYKMLPSDDARLNNNKIYKINVVFRCYLDKTGNKPSLMRAVIAEQCLSRAQKLDETFTNTLYRVFDLPENYLYNKLANITRKQKSNKILENKIPENKIPENKILENKIPENKIPENKIPENKIPENKIPENIAINMPNKRGGKVTKKYNKNMTLKHKTSATDVIFINNNIYQ